jgi:hypothetical protein
LSFHKATQCSLLSDEEGFELKQADCEGDGLASTEHASSPGLQLKLQTLKCGWVAHP